MKNLLLLKNLLYKQPFSLKGCFAIIISSLCLLYLGREKSDLVATIIGISIFLALFITLVTLTITLRRTFRSFTKSILENPLISGTTSEKIFSNTETFAPIFISDLQLPPFFNLKITRKFNQINNKVDSQPKSKTLVLSGSFSRDSNNAVVLDKITFPHRGEYSQSGIWLTFGDSLGLTRISKFIPLPLNFSVYPQEVTIQALPIMAASAQLGDVEHSNLERTGDLFDIREYQPGDSLKRVLWKVYARSNNVVVRHPEPAIVPEGEVAIFVLAQRKDDIVASAALNYLKILEEQNIIYSISCLGNPSTYTKSIIGAEELIIKSANSSDADVGQGFQNYINELKSKNFSSHQIIVFITKEFFEDPSLALNNIKLLNAVTSIATNNNLTISFALVPNRDPQIIHQIDESSNSFIQKVDNLVNSTYAKSKIAQVIANKLKNLTSTKSMTNKQKTNGNNPFNSISNTELEITHVQFSDY